MSDTDGEDRDNGGEKKSCFHKREVRRKTVLASIALQRSNLGVESMPARDRLAVNLDERERRLSVRYG